MNKLDFLRRLDKELGILDNEEKKEILAFYEERFYTGTIYENKTEEEVISELESPEVIAKNVLSEYGVSPKYVKTKEERYAGVDFSKLIVLLLFDLFIVSWLIPTLYSIVFSIFASLLSYVGVIGLLFGSPSTTDEFLFAFSTAGYVLLFLFGLIVLELTIYTTKKIIIYHMNVFKIRNRDKITKKLHRISVDGWFRKHKTVSSIKTLMFVGSLVVLAYTGFHLFMGETNIFNEYSNQPQTTDVYAQDLNNDIVAMESWEIITDFDYMDIEIIPVLGTEIKITHKYEEFHDFEIDINDDTNTLTISNDVPSITFWYDIDSIFSFFGQKDSVVIEIPIDLLLEDIDLTTANGEVVLIDVEIGELNISTMNGKIRVDSITVSGDINITTSNGEISIKDVTGTYELYAKTSNGRIIVKNVEFTKYYLYSSNGRIILEDLNVTNQDGLILDADTSNGDIELIDVYVKDVSLDTSNGDIDYHNTDLSFKLDRFVKETSIGEISSNVD